MKSTQFRANTQSNPMNTAQFRTNIQSDSLVNSSSDDDNALTLFHVANEEHKSVTSDDESQTDMSVTLAAAKNPTLTKLAHIDEIKKLLDNEIAAGVDKTQLFTAAKLAISYIQKCVNEKVTDLDEYKGSPDTATNNIFKEMIASGSELRIHFDAICKHSSKTSYFFNSKALTNSAKDVITWIKQQLKAEKNPPSAVDAKNNVELTTHRSFGNQGQIAFLGNSTDDLIIANFHADKDRNPLPILRTVSHMTKIKLGEHENNHGKKDDIMLWSTGPTKGKPSIQNGSKVAMGASYFLSGDFKINGTQMLSAGFKIFLCYDSNSEDGKKIAANAETLKQHIMLIDMNNITKDEQAAIYNCEQTLTQEGFNRLLAIIEKIRLEDDQA